MSYKSTIIGIDNGTSGTIGVLCKLGETYMISTPTIIQQNYTKTKANISRIDYKELYKFLEQFKGTGTQAVLERPMVNPGRFKASISAVRALEATLIILEQLEISYSYIDSKEWQGKILPIGLKGVELKKASMDIGCRLYPQYKDAICKHKDADGLLIATYWNQTFNN